jgi:uncharacterized protein (TIGR00369 family)
VTTKALQSLQAELDRCPFHDFLGLEALTADARTTVVRMPFRPELGLDREREAFHGGVLASLIDITAHAAVALRVGRVAPTVDLRIDYLRPAQAAFVVAEATILRAGRALARADVTVQDPAGVVVACGRGTFSTLLPN